MKKNIFLIRTVLLSVYFLFMLDALSYAQRYSNVKIDGTLPESNTQDTIEVRFYKYYYNGSHDFPDTMYTIIAKKNHFNVSIPLLNHPGYISLSFSKNHSYDLDSYLTEPGDDIRMKPATNQFEFSGRYAAKYNCRQQIDQLAAMEKSKTANDSLTLTGARYQGSFNNLFAIRENQEKFVAELLKVVQSFKTTLSNDAFAIMQADCKSEIMRGIYQQMYNLILKQRDPATEKNIYEYYENYFKERYIDTSNSKVLIYSKAYSFYILSNSLLTVAMGINNFELPLQTTVKFEEIYNYLKQHFTGILRDRLLSDCFVEYYYFKPDASKFIADAIKTVTTPDFNEIIERFNVTKAKGAMPFEFELPDPNGKIFSLKNAKGKVVLIDFWFTGCGACMLSSSAMPEVIDNFANDTDVLFLTVSVDATAARWAKGLHSHMYTSEKEINLYTGEMGLNHPLIKHYNYQAYPQFLLIGKDGLIYTSNPPTPWPGTSKGKELIDLIEEARQQ